MIQSTGSLTVIPLIYLLKKDSRDNIDVLRKFWRIGNLRAAFMALSINQKLSLLVAVLELLVASRWPQFSRPDWGFFNVPTLVFLGLTFIWLGNSFSGLRRINE